MKRTLILGWFMPDIVQSIALLIQRIDSAS